MEPLEITFDRKKLIGGSLAFILALSMFLWNFIFLEKNLTQILVTIFGVTVFPFLIRFFLTRLIRDKPAIIISQQGVWDNSTYLPLGWIKWEEIEEIQINHSFKMVSLSIKEPVFFVKKTPNWLKKMLIRINFKFSKNNTINLNHKLTKMTYLDLSKELENYQKESGFSNDFSEHLVDDNG